MSAPTAADLSALLTSQDLGAVKDKYGSIEGLAKELGSDPVAGLLAPTVLLHRKTYGTNAMPIRQPKKLWMGTAQRPKGPRGDCVNYHLYFIDHFWVTSRLHL